MSPSRSYPGSGLADPRQRFVRRRHRSTISTSCCSSTCVRGASATAAGRRRSRHGEAPVSSRGILLRASCHWSGPVGGCPQKRRQAAAGPVNNRRVRTLWRPRARAPAGHLFTQITNMRPTLFSPTPPLLEGARGLPGLKPGFGGDGLATTGLSYRGCVEAKSSEAEPTRRWLGLSVSLSRNP